MAHELPAAEAALDSVRIALDRVRVGAEQLHRRIGTVASGADNHRLDRAGYDRACHTRTGAQSDHPQCAAALERARRTIRTLEEAIGASEQDILAGAERREFSVVGLGLRSHPGRGPRGEPVVHQGAGGQEDLAPR